MNWTAAEMARVMGGRIESGRNTMRIASISIDSRSLERGALFFAIVGERHDGHRFVGEALGRGAGGVVVSQGVETPEEALKIKVGDTRRALQDLAAAVRRASEMKVVAITGSMGKTTTKEATAAALSARYRVLKSEGNLNNLYGLPLSILKHRDEDAAVLEMGMSAPGEIARLTQIARPDVGVLTNVAEVHLAFFPSLEAIARAKGEMFAELPPEAVAVVNADDPLALEEARRFDGRQIRYGLRSGVELRADEVRRTVDGVFFVARYGEERADVEAPLVGRHNVYNLLAALAAASALEVPLAHAAEGFARLRPPEHRGERLRFPPGFLVIDETYNSNPSALVAALDVLSAERAQRRIAVLGDMLELGDRADALHRDCGRAVAARDVDLLIGVGDLARALVEGARRAGMPDERLVHVRDAEAAGHELVRRARSGDVVLLKASRGIGLEHTITRMRERYGEVES